jgi:lysophospholipase L1-like esterase
MKPAEFLNRKIAIHIPVWTLFLLPLAAYAAWEIFWFTRVGLRVVKWHTHLALFAYLWAAGFIFYKLLKGRIDQKKAVNFLMVFTSIVFALAVLELFFEISGINKTYMEKVSKAYDSPYTPQDKTYYHAWAPGKPHLIEKPEYAYWRPTNSLGFGDREWNTVKPKNEKRLMALGDSFTEGDGAPYDSSYVSLLNKKLLSAGDTFYVMNAGVCGSDPFNNYIFLKNKLLVYKPDVILQVLASNDMTTDIILRGGMERFQKDGTQKFRPGPWWEPIYAVSYISRIFFKMAGYDELLKKQMQPEDERWMNAAVIDLFKQYSTICKQNGIRLYILLRPDKGEIMQNKYDYRFSEILDSIQKNKLAEVIDLLPFYQAYLAKNKEDAFPYFWAYDGHHNPKGYEMMAQSVYESLGPQLTDSVSAQAN